MCVCVCMRVRSIGGAGVPLPATQCTTGDLMRRVCGGMGVIVAEGMPAGLWHAHACPAQLLSRQEQPLDVQPAHRRPTMRVWGGRATWVVVC